MYITFFVGIKKDHKNFIKNVNMISHMQPLSCVVYDQYVFRGYDQMAWWT